MTAAVWYFRYTLFDLLYAWNGVRPSDGALLGTIVVAAAGACVPIVAFHFTHMQVGHRHVDLLLRQPMQVCDARRKLYRVRSSSIWVLAAKPVE